MNDKLIIRNRTQAFLAQGQRCHYCTAVMWLKEPAEFASRFGLSERQASPFQCTAEHRIARRDGGRDDADNIVAACLECNSGRHKLKLPPDSDCFREIIAAKVRRARWHHRWAYDRGLLNR